MSNTLAKTTHACSRCTKPARHITLEEYPKTAEYPRSRWAFMCTDCGNPTPAYYVDLERIRTERQALSWMMHLSQKLWFEETVDSWNAILERLFPGIRDDS